MHQDIDGPDDPKNETATLQGRRAMAKRLGFGRASLYLPVLCVLSSSVLGCGTPPKVRIIDTVSVDGSYGVRDVELETLRNIDRIAGEAGQFFGAADISVGLLTPPRDQGENRHRYVSSAQPVAASWVEVDDVAVATDFDTLLMFTAYAHFEHAMGMFRNWGVNLQGQDHKLAPEDRVQFYYAPNVRGSFILGIPESDNAAYVAGLDVFLVLPMEKLKEIPFGMNRGVIAHEYAHRVWYYRMWNGAMLEYVGRLEDDAFIATSMNLLRATDEGVADFFGALAANDPRFMEASTNVSIADDRDVSARRYLPSQWLSGEEPTTSGVYNPYPLGSIVASTLWRVAQHVGTDVLSRALLQAEMTTGMDVRSSGTYQIGSFEVNVLGLRLPRDFFRTQGVLQRLSYANSSSSYHDPA